MSPPCAVCGRFVLLRSKACLMTPCFEVSLADEGATYAEQQVV
jgi:hypothetical protein